MNHHEGDSYQLRSLQFWLTYETLFLLYFHLRALHIKYDAERVLTRLLHPAVHALE